jgi:excisionase family DNA binding protein
LIEGISILHILSVEQRKIGERLAKVNKKSPADQAGLKRKDKRIMAQNAEKSKPLPEMMNLVEAAQYLRVNRKTLMEKIERDPKALPHLKFGRTYRFSKAALDKAMCGVMA